jgi:hypothetical protein
MFTLVLPDHKFQPGPPAWCQFGALQVDVRDVGLAQGRYEVFNALCAERDSSEVDCPQFVRGCNPPAQSTENFLRGEGGDLLEVRNLSGVAHTRRGDGLKRLFSLRAKSGPQRN